MSVLTLTSPNWESNPGEWLGAEDTDLRPEGLHLLVPHEPIVYVVGPGIEHGPLSHPLRE